jgi:DNA-dependent metalloprotease WSS1
VPIEQVIDTMLHELSHIAHGPHDANFHALWNQLRDEHAGLIIKGYTGEGFLSEGHRLGGSRKIPMQEARRLARNAAENRRTRTSSSAQRQGGNAPIPGDDRRGVIVGPIERRTKTLQGCGNTKHNDQEIQEISETATKNGFRTQAEEDAANDAAIAQALWELVQEDEKAKYGDSYIPPTIENPTGNGGGSVFGGSQVGSRHPTAGATTGPRTSSRPTSPSSGRHVESRGWTCAICTLHNPRDFLCCDACGTEKVIEQSHIPKRKPHDIGPEATTKRKATASSSRQYPPRQDSRQKSTIAATADTKWQCSFCGTSMDRQWWTCSVCGLMKESSK